MNPLVLTTYRPNYNDPRVLRRVERVMLKCAVMLRNDAEQPIMARDLRKIFGNYSTKNTLASYLYSNLMRQTLWYSKDQHPYSYRVSEQGFQKILRELQDES